MIEYSKVGKYIMDAREKGFTDGYNKAVEDMRSKPKARVYVITKGRE